MRHGGSTRRSFVSQTAEGVVTQRAEAGDVEGFATHAGDETNDFRSSRPFLEHCMFATPLALTICS
jgi:hypothetical protein